MKRIGAIDALRGITILAMILCAAINWGSGLPAWMFHCQTPPPDFSFHPEVRGLTWVDLVFPVFIFSMGAALPIALRRRLEKGETTGKVILGLVRRWAVLVLFALVLGAGEAANGTSSLAPLFRAGLWLCLFAALVRTGHKWINYAGWALIAVLVLLEWLCMGVTPSLKNNDCIIMLLAHVSLMGGLIWLFTRDSIRLRALVLMVVIVAKMAGFGFTQYLVIALPATMLGDLLIRNQEDVVPAKYGVVLSVVATAAVLVQFWGLFERWVVADLVITLVLGAVFVALSWKDRSPFTLAGWTGFVMLAVGVALDPVCGGIAKDYCNISYLLVTGGQSALMLSVLLVIESKFRLSPVLTMTGQNPMIAYTVAWYVICPLLTLVGVMGWMGGFCSQGPWLGFLQGCVITALTAGLTMLFTHFKLFLRS